MLLLRAVSFLQGPGTLAGAGSCFAMTGTIVPICMHFRAWNSDCLASRGQATRLATLHPIIKKKKKKNCQVVQGWMLIPLGANGLPSDLHLLAFPFVATLLGRPFPRSDKVREPQAICKSAWTLSEQPLVCYPLHSRSDGVRWRTHQSHRLCWAVLQRAGRLPWGQQAADIQGSLALGTLGRTESSTAISVKFF